LWASNYEFLKKVYVEAIRAATNSIMRYHWQINNYSTLCVGT
jgi:hypothetical protein